MKKYLSLLFVLIFSLIVFAQKTISGVITDSDGKALARASVTIEEPGKCHSCIRNFQCKRRIQGKFHFRRKQFGFENQSF